jgi:competence protein ComEA
MEKKEIVMKNIRYIAILASAMALSFSVNSSDFTSPNGVSSKTNTTSELTETVTSLININTATEKQLVALKGIGIKKAKAIIAYRELNGDFARIEDLRNVKGVGSKLVLKLKALIKV